MNSEKINRIRSYYYEHQMFSELQGFDIGMRLFADNEQKKQNFWQKHKGKIIAAAALAGLGGLAYANKDKIGDAINSWRIRKSIPAGMGTVPVISETNMPKREAKSDKEKTDKQTPSTGHGASVPAQNEPAGTKDIKQSSTVEQNAPAQDKKNKPSETKPKVDVKYDAASTELTVNVSDNLQGVITATIYRDDGDYAVEFGMRRSGACSCILRNHGTGNFKLIISYGGKVILSKNYVVKG
jgi:hypothetical protein